MFTLSKLLFDSYCKYKAIAVPRSPVDKLHPLFGPSVAITVDREYFVSKIFRAINFRVK
jgi:hypothetical protein